MKSSGEKKKRKLPKRFFLVVVTIIAVYVAAVTVTATVLDERHVRFYMTAPAEMELECFHEYKEPGIYAVTSGGLFGETEKHLEVSTKSDLDNTKLGEYTIEYTVHFWLNDYSTERKVNVVDTTAPVIELKHSEGYEPSWFTGYEEEGYTATDNYDGDLTAEVTSYQDGDSMVYTVTDSSGNVGRAVREQLFTYSEPEIELYGDEDMYVNSSLSFTDPGYYAQDSRGDDLTEYVQVEGEVCPYKVGDYQLIYYIQNLQGETVSAERTVHVQPIKNPDTVSPDSNTIYLTFDDGPGPYTSELLDVLAKYNVKATFFVTGANSKYFDQIAREYNEGHSVGVHSYSHNYKTVYASEEAFFNDFNATEDLIYSQTGSYTKLFRFPGGSSNTVSSFTPGIMTALAKDMTDMGYQYFDWNVSSGDAGETTKTDQVVKNIINGCKGRKASVVLQHDIKDYSVAAVEQVIIWGLNNGYVFSALDVSSPAAHHGINN
jgi:peptidoglycan/xylan/chitin deacetylase (PgdA/CDA1 family)